MHVQTDHRIIPFGDARMVLQDCADDAAIVVAERVDAEWKVTADGLDDRTASARADAIGVMVDMALNRLPDDGYSTFIPSILWDLP